MRRVWADAKAFGVQFMRSKVGAFFAFAFPVILILLFGAIFSGGGDTKIPVYVQDLDDTSASRAFVEALNGTTIVSYRQIPKGVDIRAHIEENSINIALRIPQGFQAAVASAMAGNTTARVNVTVYGDPTQSSYGIALSAVSGAATAMNFGIAGFPPVIGTSTESISRQSLEFIDFFLPGVIGLTVLLNPLFGMTNVCAEYRTRKYFKLLASTTLSKGEWLAAKILFYTLLMFASVAIMVVLNTVVWGGKAAVTPMAVLIILAGTVQFTSLGMILGMYAKDVETAAAVANAIGFPMMFLSGSFFQIEAMPPLIQAIASAMPLTYVNEGLRATMVFGNESLAFTYLMVTAVLAAIFFIIPARALSWKSK